MPRTCKLLWPEWATPESMLRYFAVFLFFSLCHCSCYCCCCCFRCCCCCGAAATIHAASPHVFQLLHFSVSWQRLSSPAPLPVPAVKRSLGFSQHSFYGFLIYARRTLFFFCRSLLFSLFCLLALLRKFIVLIYSSLLTENKN